MNMTDWTANQELATRRVTWAAEGIADLAQHGADRMPAGVEEDRHRRIAEAAYFKSEHRGFAPGQELDDWLEAEVEIDAASRPFPSY